MPGWHAATQQLREEGKILTVGIVQEQHPHRARLFMQWKRMDWPVLVDALDLLDVGVVPITLLIDEHGIIRVRPGRDDPAAAVSRFIATSFDAPPAQAVRTTPAAPDAERLKRSAEEGTAADWRRYGEALVLWGGPTELDRAIAALTRSVELDRADARAEFRLGVAYRMRYDAEGGEASDFRHAVEHWSRARRIDPNNYIWMRRLQQFGPRRQKPYPFYDWLTEARAAIEARGETPVTLPVEPRGAELAAPSRALDPAVESAVEPDPEGRIHRDPGKLVRIETTTVSASIPPSGTARVHLDLRPDPDEDAHWNNEVGGLVVWLDPPQGWRVDRRRIEVAPPPRPVSDEVRRVEFEIEAPTTPDAASRLPGYALYYVCEGLKGRCLYRRQDLSIELRGDRIRNSKD